MSRSIADSLSLLSETLGNCKTNLKEKSVEDVDNIKISDVDEKIAEIQSGGGGDGFKCLKDVSIQFDGEDPIYPTGTYFKNIATLQRDRTCTIKFTTLTDLDAFYVNNDGNITVTSKPSYGDGQLIPDLTMTVTMNIPQYNDCKTIILIFRPNEDRTKGDVIAIRTSLYA